MDLHFEGKHDRPWPNRQLENGAIVGHTTGSAARLWLRTRDPGKFCLAIALRPIPIGQAPKRAPGKAVEIRYASGARERPAQLVSFETTRATDNTVVVDLSGLRPGTRYYYAAFAVQAQADPWEIGKDDPLYFETPKDDGSCAFGIFSCHMPYPDGASIANMGMWDALGRELADAKAACVIGGGDQVYVDGNSDLSIWKWLRKVKNQLPARDSECREIMKSWYRDIYRGYWGPLQLQRVLRRFPTYMIWDDHEIMDGWGSFTDEELSDRLDSIWEWENESKNLRLAHLMWDAAKAVYHEYEHSHNPPTVAGVYDYSFEQGPAAFYVLDMRGNRRFGAGKTQILGKEQMQRFHDWVDATIDGPAKALFVVSPVPVVHLCSILVNTADIPALGLADDLRDEWEFEDHHRERNRLLKKVFEASGKKGKPVVFLSGDVHIGAAFKLSRRANPLARVFQLTSSGITYYSRLGPLLRLGLRERGTLDGATNQETTTFELLQSFTRNNFGIVRVGRSSEYAVEWDLYGRSDADSSIVRLERLLLE